MIDLAHLDMMTAGDAALQSEVFALFEDQAALWRRLLTADAPISTWRDVAHSIKGSARGLGLWDLADQCARAEALAAGGGAHDRRMVSAELAGVRAQLDAALAAICRWRAGLADAEGVPG